MRETKYSKPLYKAIRKLNIDKEELKQTLLCLYISGCSSEDCARLFGTSEEKVIKFLESECLHYYQSCSKCGKLRDRENNFRQRNNQKLKICIICEKEREKEHHKEYYENNKDLIKEKRKEYYENNKEYFIELVKGYHENNKDKIKEYAKSYHENNKEKLNEYHKEYYENNKDKIKDVMKEYYENNKDKRKECVKEYRENNKEKIREYRENNKEKLSKYNKEYSKWYHKSSASVEQVQKLANYEEVSGNQIRCKYCGRWVIPIVSQVNNRIRGIEENDTVYIYCSEECKNECPVYRQMLHPKGFKPASSREVNPVLRQIVLARDEYTCQKCHKSQEELTVGLHCHHVTPYADSPMEADDPEVCITFCKDCHEEVHKIPGCRYHELRCN